MKEVQQSMQTDKICMMMTRLACNRAIESSYWRMDNDSDVGLLTGSDVGLLTGYVLYRLPLFAYYVSKIKLSYRQV
jgi:hypothetical protein